MDSHVESIEECFRAIDESKDPDQIQELLDEAKETLSQMRIEIHSITQKPRKDAYLSKMSNYDILLSKHRKALLTGTAGGSRPSGASSASSQASQTERSAKSLETLQKARAQLAEAEEVGVNVLENLGKQKETIKATRGKLEETSHELSYSNKMLNRMSKWWRG
jgi:enoyl-[acyl-carrier-protein] reductase (NADH)